MKYKLVASRRSAAITRGINKLKTYKTTNKAAQDLINIVIGQYENRDILNIQTAASLAHSLMHNNLNEFGKKYAVAMVWVAKQQAKREESIVKQNQVADDLVKVIDRVVHRPSIKTKNWESESNI